DEPAADLPACFAIASSAKEIKLPPATVFIGEVGLAGEIRNVNHLQQRLDEAARLGFKQAVLPKIRGSNVQIPKELKLIQLRNLREGLERFYLVD
ncbi:MAG: magnesium chelatase domain-containing protein, partial [Planctomycetota bacterium]